MFTVTVGEYALRYNHPGSPPRYAEHAMLAEVFGGEREPTFVAVARAGGSWPFLAVTWHSCEPGMGFDPSAVIVPETDVLFLGGGDRVFAYDLAVPRRLWDYTAAVGLWDLHRHGDVVIMSEELEMRAWDTHARLLWSASVEPPWTYTVEDGWVNLDVMGKRSRFPLTTGPAQTR